MMREYQVRICERLGVKFPGPTRRKADLGEVRFWRQSGRCGVFVLELARLPLPAGPNLNFPGLDRPVLPLVRRLMRRRAQPRDLDYGASGDREIQPVSDMRKTPCHAQSLRL